MLVYIRPCKLHHFKKVLGGGHAPEPPSKAHDSKSENNLCPPPTATCWLPWLVGKGVNPGGDGGDISPPCFDMGGITCLLSPPCFDPQICFFLFWKINNIL